MELRRALLVLPLSLLLAGGARAIDGVIEIDALRAAAGGITAGDLPGYPVTLSASGSYRLTGELVVQDQTAIEITGDHVSLDLNGFGIRCATSCTTGHGIWAPVQGSAIRNGYVRGMGETGIFGGTRARLVDLDASGNGGAGISGGSGCLARNLRAHGNGGSGISCAGVLQDSVAGGNGRDGIVVVNGVAAHNESVSNGLAPSGSEGNGLAMSGGVATGNLVDDAGLDGVRVQQTTLLLDNVITRSALRGVFHMGFGDLGYGGNNFDDNASGSLTCVIGGVCLQVAKNLCAGSIVCP